MAIAYSEFMSTPANVAADIRTKILLSTDWSRPNSGSFPNLVSCTTTNSGTMIVDVGAAALVSRTYAIPVRAWRAHNGTTGTDSKDFDLHWRLSSGGASTDPLHVTVSASKDMLWIQIEGPRPSEANVEDATRGSAKTSFFMTALNPYFGGDTNPVVVAGGKIYANTTLINRNDEPYGAVFVSQGATASTPAWAAAVLATVQPPPSFSSWTPQPVALLDSGNYYMFPYVVIENDAGIRGTLTDLYYAGINVSIDTSNGFDHPAPVGELVTYSSKTYKLLTSIKGDYGAGNNQIIYAPLGAFTNTNAADWFRSTVVGVRSA